MRKFQSFSASVESSLLQPPKTPNESDMYAEPENFLEIEVANPKTHFPHAENRGMYTDYEVICRTNLPSFTKRTSKVRRRYSEFELFRKCLLKELSLSSHPKVVVPHLPGKIILGNRFSDEAIEERKQDLNKWMFTVAGHPLLQSGSKVLVRFIENKEFLG
ncbi:LANO_0C01112g1_1 [Lachancea nothofagi CBS 11611]|uniref:Sorting nexin-3 n=1 Tax=Lachancea nothofagi CBS 11611 TaxID=1266666 RepID=A0A1G4J4F3_9SACH|nr:LANO_0C01112g1_1 [Lachancea nothofagi CBS 11611]